MNTKSVYLYFPYSTHCDELNKSFVLSYNDACKSDFIKVLLENEDHEHNDCFHIVIPHNLYMDIRYVDIEYTIQYFDLDDEGRSMTKEYEGAVTNNAGKFTSKHYTTPQSSDFVLANDKVNFMPMNQDYFKTLELDLDILSRTEIYDIGDTIIVDVESILENPNTPVFDAPGGAGGGTGGGGLGGGVGFS